MRKDLDDPSGRGQKDLPEDTLLLRAQIEVEIERARLAHKQSEGLSGLLGKLWQTSDR